MNPWKEHGNNEGNGTGYTSDTFAQGGAGGIWNQVADKPPPQDQDQPKPTPWLANPPLLDLPGENQQCYPSSVNPFHQNWPTVKSKTSNENEGRSSMDRVLRYNPSTVTSLSPRGRGRRGKRDAGYYRKTPRYCFPERPDIQPVKFIPAGTDVDAIKDEADEVPSTPQGYIRPVSKGQGQEIEQDIIIKIDEDVGVLEGVVTVAAAVTHAEEDAELELVARKSFKKGKRRIGGVVEYGPNALKKLKMTPDKPATAVVNEISPALEFVYEDLRASSQDEPKFICKVNFPVGETTKEYIGKGRSKKLAKLNACEDILRDLGLATNLGIDGTSVDVDLPPDGGVFSCGVDVEMGLKQNIVPARQLFVSTPYFMGTSVVSPFHDFTEDVDIVMNSSDFSVADINQQAIEIPSVKRLQNIPDIETNVLAALNLLIGTESYECVEISEDGPAHDKKFVVQFKLKTGMTFEGFGQSKKRAKQHAAKQALISIIGPQVYQLLVASGSSKVKMTPQSNKINVMNNRESEKLLEITQELFKEDLRNASEYDITFSDYIARIVNEKYEEIMENHQEHISQKVLAGVVMTRCNPMLENGEIVAVTTGTKCVEGDFMSTDGLAVNDCHAEILATRCLRDFLYSEVENFACSTCDEEREQSILVELESCNGEIMYMVKDNVKFHLYISTSPCGDARIFSPKGLETDDEKESIDDLEDSHPTKRNRGLLRAKVEAGEGTIPVANLISGVQTFDSIVHSSALYTMSCSDKLCRWNAVGIQGALLSNLMHPVHYSSITLGSLHHPVHFRRALIGRIESLAGKIPLPFRINRPHLLMVSHQETRKVKKSPNHAVCWVNGWSTPEILAASKGRCEPRGIASRLAKRMAFIRFLTLYKNQTGRREGFADLSYREAKLMAVDYQKAIQAFRAYMKESNFGSWIAKPLEIDSFHITK